MSLKTKLGDLIKYRGEVSFREIEEFSRRNSYRLSNSERRLREMPEVEPVFNEKSLFNKKRYITGYKWVEVPLPLA